MTPKKPAPARLFVLLAGEAPVGVIFRRKPTKWTQLIKWNTATDIFELGQWFKGRVHVLSSDLSPNGEFLLYLADKYSNSTTNPDIGNVWTAISRPPYFSALALWPRGTGGYFIDDESLHVGFGEITHPDFPLKGLKLRLSAAHI